MLKYAAISDGTQNHSSGNFCSGIHLNFTLLMTKGFVYVFGSSIVTVTSKSL